MERRNRSLKALEKLNHLDSLEDEPIKAQLLERWVHEFLDDTSIEDFDLNLDDMKKLSELFYKNINFLKTYRDELKVSLNSHHKIKKFLN